MTVEQFKSHARTIASQIEDSLSFEEFDEMYEELELAQSDFSMLLQKNVDGHIPAE